ELVIALPRSASLRAVVREMLRSSYLASIAGGRATWIVEGNRPLAVVAQQWWSPRWLVEPELAVSAVSQESGSPDLMLRYWCQVDPKRVYDCLRAGEPLPDRYGR
ncbi:MAG TPA: hypothetical protein VF625_16495, partial [Longimicrobium sp.]